MSNNAINEIVIVGGGTAGWLTAAAFSRVLPEKQYKVTLVESDMIGAVGVGEATIPPIRDFHRMLGVNEAEFVRATQATFKLGIEFENWGRDKRAYFHPFGEYGREFDSVAFHQYWQRGQQLGNKADLSDYSLCTVAAKRGKFAPNSNDPQSVLSSIGYAYHFDASLYAMFLREYSEKNGVVRIEGKVVDVDLDNENGQIQSIRLDSSQTISGDFFIDCTGFSALLIGKALGVDYEDWSHVLPANRAFAVQTEKDTGAIKPYTISTAHSSGWQWKIPLQHRAGNGLVYSDQFIDDDKACELLMNNLSGRPLTEPRQLSFTTGKRVKSWHKNCVAIGLSSGFLEPLESTSIHLIQTAISRLLQLLPGKEFCTADINEYNDGVNREVEFIRDFIVLHYHLNQRAEPLWEYCREMPVPDSLSHKIEMFQNRGRLFDDQYDLFKKASWVAVMKGQGITPNYYDSVADYKPADRLLELLAEMRKVFSGAADAMPTHDEFIAQNCAAPRPV